MAAVKNKAKKAMANLTVMLVNGLMRRPANIRVR
jgi:hypothetical protein